MNANDNDRMIVTLTIGEFKKLISEEVSLCLNIVHPVIQGSNKEEFMTRDETAKALKISLPTLSALSKAGAITSYRLGRGRVLYKSAEVAMALTKVATK